jgi:hypothetical protein
MNVPTTRRRLAAAAAVSLAALGLSAPAASAGEDESIDVNGGYVLFLDEDELLIAADQRRDGYGMRAYLLEVGTSSVTAVGAGERETKDLSIPEGSEVWLKACYTKKGKVVKCSNFQRAEA